MYKKLSNAAWEEAINKYYSDNHELTIKDYCFENNLKKSQFYYHKKRLSNKNKKAPVFQAIKLDDNDLTDELSKFLTGFKMMYASLCEVLKKFGVEEIDCEGKEFDANTMQALMTDSDSNFEDDIVLDVLLKGYRLKDRVIRPASVKVTKIEK